MDWKLLEAKIIAAVAKVAKQHYEVYEERWVTDEVLCEHVGLMTKRWLRENGYLLPRTPIAWKDKDGIEHTSKQYFTHFIRYWQWWPTGESSGWDMTRKLHKEVNT